MGEYVVQSGSMKRKVDKIMRLITDEIVSRFSPESIILSGSFGRNEGAIALEGEKLRFLSDCEIIVVTSKYISGNVLRSFSSELTKKTGIDVGIWWNSPIKFVSPLVKKCTITNYELKYGSKILYGKNYLEKIPDFEPEDIPLWEGIRLLFNRIVESMKHFSIGYLNTPPPEEKKQKLLYSISKLILACQDALLLCIKKFSPSYKMRSEMFKELFPKHFKELGALSDYLLLTSKATSYKLNPKNNIFSRDYEQLWFDTGNLCDTTFRYVIKRDAGITFNTYSEFQEKYLKHPNITEKYYREISGMPIYQNFKSMLSLWTKARKVVSLKALRNIGTPWIHMIYSTIPLVYFSFSNRARIDEVQLRQARKILFLFKELRIPNPNIYEEWEYLRAETYNLWSVLCVDFA